MRKAWGIGDNVEVYSQSAKRWLKGQIKEIKTDEEGEWLAIYYKKSTGQTNRKEVKRFSKFIRPADAPESKKTDAKSSPDPASKSATQPRVFVRSLSDGAVVSVDLPLKTGLRTKVKHLKHLISEREIGFPIERQRLYVEDTKLLGQRQEGSHMGEVSGGERAWLDELESTLEDAGVTDGSTLVLTKLKNVVYVTVRGASGTDGESRDSQGESSRRVEVPLQGIELESPASALRDAICRAVKAPKKHSRLLFGTKLIFGGAGSEAEGTPVTMGVRLESELTLEISPSARESSKPKNSKKKRATLAKPRCDRCVDYFFVLGLRKKSMGQRRRASRSEQEGEIERVVPITDIRFAATPKKWSDRHFEVKSYVESNRYGDGWVGTGYLYAAAAADDRAAMSATASGSMARPITSIEVVSRDTKRNIGEYAINASQESFVVLGKNATMKLRIKRSLGKSPIVDMAIVPMGDPPPLLFERVEPPLQKSTLFGAQRFHLCVRYGDVQTDIYDPELLDRYPRLDYRDYPREFNHEAIVPYVFPNGLRLTQYRPVSGRLFHNFSFSIGAERRVFYGCAMTIFEEFAKSVDGSQAVRVVASDADETAMPGAAGDRKRPASDGGTGVHFAAGCAPPPSAANPFSVPQSRKIYCPKALVLIAQDPQYSGMNAFLSQLYAIFMTPSAHHAPIEAWIWSFFNKVPDPRAGLLHVEFEMTAGRPTIDFTKPPPLFLPHRRDFKLGPLFSCLSVENAIRLYELMLGEAQIVIVSSDVALLGAVAEAYRSLLFPFEWQRIWIPLLPADPRFAQYLISMWPFVIGLQRSFLNQYRLPEAEAKRFEIVDLDDNTIHEHTDCRPRDAGIGKEPGAGPRIPHLPQQIRADLKATLAPLDRTRHRQSMGSALSTGRLELLNLKPEVEEKVRIAFLKTNIRLLWSYQSFCIPKGTVDKAALVRSRDKSASEFYDSLIETQLYRNFADWRGSPDFTDVRYGASKHALRLIFFDFCMSICRASPAPRPPGISGGAGAGAAPVRFGSLLTPGTMAKVRALCRVPPVRRVCRAIGRPELWSKKGPLKARGGPFPYGDQFPTLDKAILSVCDKFMAKTGQKKGDTKRSGIPGGSPASPGGPPCAVHPMHGNRFYAIDPMGLDHWLSDFRQTACMVTNRGLQLVADSAETALYGMRLRLEQRASDGGGKDRPRQAVLGCLSSVYELWFRCYLLSSAHLVRKRVWQTRNEPDADNQVCEPVPNPYPKIDHLILFLTLTLYLCARAHPVPTPP